MRSGNALNRLVSIFLFLAFSLVFNLRGLAADQSVNPDTQAELRQQQIKMRRLQQGIESQQGLIVSSEKKESRLLDELATVSAKLNTARTRLRDLEHQLTVQQQNLEIRQKELAELTEAKEKLQQHIKKRLTAYYRMGRTGFLNAIFSSSGLSALLRFDEAFQIMLERDRQSARLYKAKIMESQQAAARVRNQQEILTALVSEVRSQEQLYSQAKKERQTLLKRVLTEKQLYEVALKEIKVAADQLSDKLIQLKKEAATEARPKELPKNSGEQKNRSQLSGLSFAAQKGRLPPPVDGTVTKGFGKSITKKFGLTLQANGITIAAPPGAAIKAIYHGKVLYVGELKGYGNIIILDHGQQYYSLISRAEKYFKKKGDRVLPGEVIGVAGEEAGLLEDGIHFEIRQGTKPLDPLEWLKPGSLKLATGFKGSGR